MNKGEPLCKLRTVASTTIKSMVVYTGKLAKSGP